MEPQSPHHGQSRSVRQDRVKLVIETLTEFVQDEHLADDAQLPPERELAAQLGVSRRLLRRGLDRLEAAGKIWRHRGKGTFVGSKPPQPTDIVSTDAATNPIEIMEARLELEPSLAALAALRATRAEARHIAWCLARSRSANDLETFELWDGTLHRAIAQAAHNSLLLTLYDMVSVARSRTFWGKLQDIAITRCGLETIWLQHKAFVDAIVERDPIEARRSMYAHIDAVRNSMFAVEKQRDE
jgi:DNA-binding FadR family transcriptional regulator